MFFKGDFVSLVWYWRELHCHFKRNPLPKTHDMRKKRDYPRICGHVTIQNGRDPQSWTGMNC